jgi:alanine-glyoxylate transaminase / (R)-3-amino-2-methylpropionate-pyruvate transaminase
MTQEANTHDKVMQKHKDYLMPSVANYYEKPAVIVEGKGCTLKDIDGKEYIDFFGGILTVSVGHANDRVNKAVYAQMNRLSHISTLYPTVPIVELAERLAKLTPGELNKSFFTASGTEADETAVMLAQTSTGNQDIIALRHGYSGRSMLAQSLNAHSAYRQVSTQVPGIKHVVSPNCYRCPFKQTYPKCGVACAQDIEEMIQTTTSGRVAGMLAEPIQGVGGFITPPKEYFQIAADIIRKYGGVFISDEVQTGFGRTGKTWGIDHFGVEPDMMTMAKGIANGLPLGAVVTTTPIAATLTKTILSTYGGNPLSCTASIETLKIMEEENLTENAANMGNILREGLLKLQSEHPKTIGDVRGMGLIQAIELVDDETIQDRTPNTKAMAQLFEETKKRGLLIGKGGLYGNAVRISPALNITADEVNESLKIMGESFKAMGAQ